MMHKSPDDRYATPMQVAQALEPFCDDPQGGENLETDGLFSAKTAAQKSPLSAPIDGAKLARQSDAGERSRPAAR